MSGTSHTRPWDIRGVRLLVGCEVTGGVLLTAAWAWSREQATLKDQYGSINLAVLGLILAAVGQFGWIFAARRSVVLRQRSALTRITAAAPRGGPPQAREAAPSAWVQVPGTRRGHRPHCQLVVGKAVVLLSRADVEARELRPCELCS